MSVNGEQAVNGLTQLLVKDIVTYEHSIRVGKMAKLMAAYLNFDELQTQKLIAGCCLHDIGKVHIHDSILKKKSSLTQEEWKYMKCHAFFSEFRWPSWKELPIRMSSIPFIIIMSVGTVQATPAA